MAVLTNAVELEPIYRSSSAASTIENCLHIKSDLGASAHCLQNVISDSVSAFTILNGLTPVVSYGDFKIDN